MARKPYQRKPCAECGGPKPPGSGRTWCDDCKMCCDEHNSYRQGCHACDVVYRAKWRERNPGRTKRYVKKSVYGLSGEQYDALEAIDACENCGSTERLVIDHNHVTGKVRGKLCHGCNVALGMARDDIATLEGLINYLKERN